VENRKNSVKHIMMMRRLSNPEKTNWEEKTPESNVGVL